MFSSEKKPESETFGHFSTPYKQAKKPCYQHQTCDGAQRLLIKGLNYKIK